MVLNFTFRKVKKPKVSDGQALNETYFSTSLFLTHVSPNFRVDLVSVSEEKEYSRNCWLLRTCTNALNPPRGANYNMHESARFLFVYSTRKTLNLRDGRNDRGAAGHAFEPFLVLTVSLNSSLLYDDLEKI